MASRIRPTFPYLKGVPFNILVVDVGGTNVKLRATGQQKPVKIPSGTSMSPRQMMSAIRREIAGWKVQAVSIGLPGLVLHGRILHEPRNLGKGWVGFDFGKAFRLPIKVINDAAMQALGSYQGGVCSFSVWVPDWAPLLLSMAVWNRLSWRTCSTARIALMKTTSEHREFPGSVRDAV